MIGEPTMTEHQIELWKQEMLNPRKKHHTVPGPAMVLRGARKKHPQPAERAAGACVHRWRISEPSGPTCEGQCQKCGETRMYATAPDDLNTSFTVRAERGQRW